MAAQRAALEPDVTRFETTIEAIEDGSVLLEETYFYAESGGQPPDRGHLDGRPVVDVKRVDGRTHHRLETMDGLAVGDRVVGTIDASFRTWCRCAHSASHVVYGAGRRLFEDLGYGGFDIGDRKVRMDLATPSSIGDAELIELERLANRAVWERRPITWRSVPVADARARDAVAFNTKTEAAVLDEAEVVRLVTVGEAERGDDDGWWDVAACGGTHVRNTADIGPIAVTDRSNPGEGLTRVELTVGEEAVRRWYALRSATSRAAQAVGTRPTDLPEAVERLTDNLEEARDRLDAATDRLVMMQLDRLREATVRVDGNRWLVGSVDGADVDTIADHARNAVGDGAAVVALTTAGERPTVCVTSDGSVDAGAVVEALTDRFGGGGGGGDRFAQAGGLGVDAERIVETLRSGKLFEA